MDSNFLLTPQYRSTGKPAETISIFGPLYMLASVESFGAHSSDGSCSYAQQDTEVYLQNEPWRWFLREKRIYAGDEYARRALALLSETSHRWRTSWCFKVQGVIFVLRNCQRSAVIKDLHAPLKNFVFLLFATCSRHGGQGLSSTEPHGSSALPSGKYSHGWISYAISYHVKIPYQPKLEISLHENQSEWLFRRLVHQSLISSFPGGDDSRWFRTIVFLLCDIFLPGRSPVNSLRENAVSPSPRMLWTTWETERNAFQRGTLEIRESEYDYRKLSTMIVNTIRRSWMSERFCWNCHSEESSSSPQL